MFVMDCAEMGKVMVNKLFLIFFVFANCLYVIVLVGFLWLVLGWEKVFLLKDWGMIGKMCFFVT